MERPDPTVRWLAAFASRPAQKVELPPGDRALRTDAQRRAAALAWPMKLDEETRSAGVFAELTSLALKLELPRALVAALHRATADELGHARLCQRMSAGDAAPSAGHGEALRARLAGLPADRRLLSLLLVEGAMGETISSHLFRAGERSTREPRARAALDAI